MLKYIVFLGGAVNLIGSFYYFKDTLKGTTRPNRVTWLIWAIAPLIVAGAALSDGVGFAVIPVFISGIAMLIVFFGTFCNPRAYWKLTGFDYICGALSVLALMFWLVVRASDVAIVLAIIVDLFALLPTLAKAWKFPETESINTYLAGIFSAATTFFALSKFSFSEMAYPLFLIFLNISVITVVFKDTLIKPHTKMQSSTKIKKPSVS